MKIHQIKNTDTHCPKPKKSNEMLDTINGIHYHHVMLFGGAQYSPTNPRSEVNHWKVKIGSRLNREK
jgi:hypothetical protein